MNTHTASNALRYEVRIDDNAQSVLLTTHIHELTTSPRETRQGPVMTHVTVNTQAELDAALTNPDHACATHEIIIDSPAGVLLMVGDDHGRDVIAYGSASVRAYDSASVIASTYVAVHLHSTRVTHTGGVIIDCTTIDETDHATWGDYHGAQVEDGTITLYKCLPQNLTSGADWGRDTVWPTSGDIECVDFEATNECGHGLHLSPTPGHAWTYWSIMSRPRFLEVTAPLDDIVPITGGTAKSRSSGARSSARWT